MLMEHGIAIRLAVAADLDRIVELEQQAATAAHWPRATYEGIISAEAAANPKRVLFVAERAGQIAGFAAARALLSDAHTPECELENIAVSSQLQRSGVGRALLLRICEWARDLGAQELDAEVRASNVAALGLYMATGFAEVGRRPSYYSAPTADAVLLKLHL
jgi:ribosomal-protein-alanine acetyltransferase